MGSRASPGQHTEGRTSRCLQPWLKFLLGGAVGVQGLIWQTAPEGDHPE